MMILRIISIMLIGCFVITIPATAVIMVGFGYQGSGDAPLAPGAGLFTSLIESGLSQDTKDQFSYAQIETGAVDVSSWPTVDVESQASLNAASIGCSPLVSDGATDNSANIKCIVDDPDSSNRCLVFQAGGIYNMNTRQNGAAVVRPSSTISNKCFKSSTLGSKYTLRSGKVECQDNNPADGACDTGTLAGKPAGSLIMFDGAPPQWGAAGAPSTAAPSGRPEDRIWNNHFGWNGGDRGDRTLTFTNVNGLSVGDYLQLESSPSGFQPVSGRTGAVEYKAKIQSISGLSGGTYTVTMDRRLPDNFRGTSIATAEWIPAKNWHMEDVIFANEFPNHTAAYFSSLFKFNNMAESTVLRSEFHGYQVGINVNNSARILFKTFDVTLTFDKPFNNYGILTQHSSDISFLDGSVDSSESIACAGGDQNTLYAYMYLPDPPANPSYNLDCPPDRDGRSACDWNLIQAHVDAHGNHADCTLNATGTECNIRQGETPAATGIAMHCTVANGSPGNERDLLGVNGVTGCNGSRSPIGSGSLILHNASCSNMLLVRSHLEGGIWHDPYDGPGRYNTIFGNLLNESGSGDIRYFGGGGGDIVHKAGDQYPNWRRDYRMNEIVIGNSLHLLGGGQKRVYDSSYDLGRIEYNAIREDCQMSSADPLIVADCGLPIRPNSASNGFHTAGASSTVLTDATYIPPTSLYDSGSGSRLIGERLWNTTDSTFCEITGHTDTTFTCSAGLSAGGSWDTNDQWAISGTSITWTGNDVLTLNGGLGTDTPVIGVKLPSLPGFTEWPTGLTGGGPDAWPYVGADMGAVSGPGDMQGCLPAFERYHGSCTQSGK